MNLAHGYCMPERINYYPVSAHVRNVDIEYCALCFALCSLNKLDGIEYTKYDININE